MIERQKRLKEVYEHLRKHCGIHTQGDFASSIGYSRPVISSAMNGNEDNLTDRLFKSICEKYENVFNLDYLLNGEGELLLPKKSTAEQQEANILELYAHMIRSIDDLRQELKKTNCRSPGVKL